MEPHSDGICRKLVEVKERVGHGKYTAFVTERLGWSERSGRRFVEVYELFKAANLAGLEALQIDASSLYLIAAPSTPGAGARYLRRKNDDSPPSSAHPLGLGSQRLQSPLEIGG
jgi:hypothetical protein